MLHPSSPSNRIKLGPSTWSARVVSRGSVMPEAMRYENRLNIREFQTEINRELSIWSGYWIEGEKSAGYHAKDWRFTRLLTLNHSNVSQTGLESESSADEPPAGAQFEKRGAIHVTTAIYHPKTPPFCFCPNRWINSNCPQDLLNLLMPS
ncbi:hypothetical protein BDZ45DRAFT_751251 [Acephala macrosclerotiorum]|nr:hypothetical protein BDZ45DRAFT_751251 [Acephala macrosclerotiorum]